VRGVPIVLMVDQRGLGWVAAVGTRLSLWCFPLQPIGRPQCRRAAMKWLYRHTTQCDSERYSSGNPEGEVVIIRL